MTADERLCSEIRSVQQWLPGPGSSRIALLALVLALGLGCGNAGTYDLDAACRIATTPTLVHVDAARLIGTQFQAVEIRNVSDSSVCTVGPGRLDVAGRESEHFYEVVDVLPGTAWVMNFGVGLPSSGSVIATLEVETSDPNLPVVRFEFRRD
ncbi:MAG TPA: hypothetical protein RMG48_00240 [Myxococcales bacterium LLY-WYZ-16_1]|nr:hypothetical protein [Myxococcales bacterium LLY-WYZ-16_1]